jgi:TRAP-type C4-dicarboxylate transport system permease small subunit
MSDNDKPTISDRISDLIPYVLPLGAVGWGSWTAWTYLGEAAPPWVQKMFGFALLVLIMAFMVVRALATQLDRIEEKLHRLDGERRLREMDHDDDWR